MHGQVYELQLFLTETFSTLKTVDLSYKTFSKNIFNRFCSWNDQDKFWQLAYSWLQCFALARCNLHQHHFQIELQHTIGSSSYKAPPSQVNDRSYQHYVVIIITCELENTRKYAQFAYDGHQSSFLKN